MAFKVQIVNISENADNIILTNNLTIELLKIRYNWVLNASVKNAVIGEDANGLVWYMGEWLCGDWEGGTWYSGIWHSGNWKKGKWYSYLLDKSMILFNKFIILDKNSTYSEFRDGTWYDGNWYDGTFGYNQSLSGLSQNTIWNSIDNKEINTAYWMMGEFNDGIFKNSIWKNGNFYKGTMFNSYWVSGRFYSGTFEKYSWKSGTWYGGDFKEGIWNEGNFLQISSGVTSRFGLNSIENSTSTISPFTTWIKGNFYSGEFHSGLKVDSSGNTLPSDNHNLTHWMGGTFHNGNWYGGSFRGDASKSIFNGGNWHGGVFNPIINFNNPMSGDCVWNGGNWYNGLWVNGIWNGGHFYNGMWLNGVFNNGYLSNDSTESGLIPVPPTTDIGLPVVKTLGYSNLSQFGATLNGRVLFASNSPVLSRGMYWSTFGPVADGETTLPINDPRYVIGSVSGGLGNYSVNATELDNGVTYYFGAFAENSEGVSYGNSMFFTTLTGTSIGIQLIRCDAGDTIIGVLSELTSAGASPIIARGLCWSDTNILPISGVTNTIVDPLTDIGEYTIKVTGLTESTTYYFRSFAVNSDQIKYSKTMSSVTTTPTLPELTLSITDSTYSTITHKSTITVFGGDILVEGIEWRTNSWNSGETITPITIPDFNGVITGLTSLTTYFIKSYVTNPTGTGYSTEIEIKTPDISYAPIVQNISVQSTYTP